MSGQGFISVDWGTSSFRGALVAPSGVIVDRRSAGDGIMSVANGDFRAVLERHVGDWRDAEPDAPIVMSGMIGSRQGWVEAPYAALPASVGSVARDMMSFDGGPRLGEILIVPGIARRADAAPPDVMRGEEAQVFGALDGASEGQRLFVLPGTHSKWVEVRDGVIVAFATYMSGEMFSALTAHTILGRLMTDADDRDDSGFADGVRDGAAAGHPGDLLNRVFAARTHGLVTGWSGGRLKSYLSGLLIGAEMAAARSRAGGIVTFTIIGSDTLASRYRESARVLGLDADVAAPDRAVAGQAALLAARSEIARRA